FFNINFRNGAYGTENRTFTMTLEEDYSISGVATVDVPTTIMKIFGNDEVALSVDCEAKLGFSDTDVMMVLDTSAWAQLGPMGDVLRATQAKKIVLDHHVAEDDLGAEMFKNTTAEAAGRLVVEAAEALGVELTEAIATPLFAALSTDTGWFRFGSTTATTYRIAAKLTEAGAKPAAIYADLYETETLARVRLRGVILERFCSELDGRLVHSYVVRDDFEKTGALPSDTEDAINMGLAIAGTQAAVIVIEQPRGGFKISFRSRCEMNCSEVAAQFGGGGHKAAAGAFLEGSLQDVQTRVLDAVRAAMR
ncbi:MAG: hypothetical protein KDA59_10855, partial [Planctomycetales bacterium]|nr:hypothetical protein [Planctomycetales bacterium]